MRYYNAEQQLLQMIFAHLAEYAARTGEAPASLLSEVIDTLPHRGQAGVVPAELFDSKRSPEERYAWLCAEMDRFQMQEAARRADLRETCETAGLPALLHLIDDADLPQSARLLREDAETLLLAFASDDAWVWGLRLSGVRATSGAIAAPILLPSVELSCAPDGGVTLAAMSAQGEISLTFSGAVEVTELYNYAVAADATTVLLPAHLRLVYRLHKLLEKALQPEPINLTEGELSLLPVSVGATFLIGRTESAELVLRFGAESACPYLRQIGDPVSAAARALVLFAVRRQENRAATLLAPLCHAQVSSYKQHAALAKFAAYIQSARGEPFCRALQAALEEATASYPAPPLLAEVGADVATAAAIVDRELHARGFSGTWPRYRQIVTLPRARLFAPNILWHARILPRGTRILSLVDCIPFLQDGIFCVNFSCGTIPLPRGTDGAQYADSESAAFDFAHRRLQRFAAGLILDAEQEADGVCQLTLAENAEAAAQSAMLEPLSPRARMCVVHANTISVGRLLLHGGLCTLLGGAAGYALGSLLGLLGGAAVASVLPVIGMLPGVGYGIYRTTLALLGRRKL